jgi:glycosyltransferase involved in cell wall biosynthesis
MRVLWVSHRAGIGGAELCLVEGVEALARRGHVSHVVLPREGSLQSRIAPLGRVHICNHNPWVTRWPGVLTTGRWTLYNARRGVPEIAQLARRIDADVIVTNTITVPAGGFAARLAGVPHVWFLHEFGARDHGLSFLYGRRLTLGLIGRLSASVLVNSEALRRDIADNVPSGKLRIVRYGVEVPAVAPGPIQKETLRMVLVGAKQPGKGQMDAIAAVAHVVSAGLDVRLDLVGSGDSDYEDKLRAFANSRGVQSNVRFVPFSDHPFRLVAESDVALMCSRAEAFGRVTVEAMKLGKPVIGAAGGATPELVRHGWNGYLYSPGDSRELARRMADLHRDRDRAREMGQRGRSWARERFNLENYGEDLETAFAGVVGGSTALSHSG